MINKAEHFEFLLLHVVGQKGHECDLHMQLAAYSLCQQ